MFELVMPKVEFALAGAPELKAPLQSVQCQRDLALAQVVLWCHPYLLEIDHTFTCFSTLVITLTLKIKQHAILEHKVALLPHFVEARTLLFHDTRMEIAVREHVTEHGRARDADLLFQILKFICIFKCVRFYSEYLERGRMTARQVQQVALALLELAFVVHQLLQVHRVVLVVQRRRFGENGGVLLELLFCLSALFMVAGRG